jgi:hypothetical protein
VLAYLSTKRYTVPALVRLSALRLVKDCNEALFGLTANGPSVLAVKKITERANALGLGSRSDTQDNNNTNEFMI